MLHVVGERPFFGSKFLQVCAVESPSLQFGCGLMVKVAGRLLDGKAWPF